MSSQRIGLFSVLFACAALAGCGTKVDFVPTNGPPQPLVKKSPEQVQIYTSAGPSKPYVEIGLLEAQQESTLSLDDRPEIMEELREEAAELGCDGIILAGANDSVTGTVIDGHGGVQTLEGYRATCFVYYE